MNPLDRYPDDDPEPWAVNPNEGDGRARPEPDEPASDPTSESDRAFHRGTDSWLAERFADDHGAHLRYCATWGRWMVWTGTRWNHDALGEVVEAAKATALRLAHDELDRNVAGESQADQTRRRGRAAAWQNQNRLRSMIELARSHPQLSVPADAFDADPWALNVANGVLNLRTGALTPHDPSQLHTKVTTASYDPAATAPRWEAFVAQILPDPAVAEFVQRSLGYALLGLVTEHKLWIAHGGGANGKSTLLEAVAAVLGDYAQTAPPDLIAPTGDPHPTIFAGLQGARFVVTSELDDVRRLAEATVKRLTGGDRVTARFMRQDYFEFQPSWSLWLGTNHRPAVIGTDRALWRRLLLIPFSVTIGPDDQDGNLPQKLRDEADGILAWLVDGARSWDDKGLAPPIQVVMATDDYRAAEDLLGRFLDECCVLDPGARVGASDLYQRYRSWCEGAGERPRTQKVFGASLTERGHEKRKTTQCVVYEGIGLLTTDAPMHLLHGDPA